MRSRLQCYECYVDIIAGTLLLIRLERALKTRVLAEETLNELIPGTMEGNLEYQKLNKTKQITNVCMHVNAPISMLLSQAQAPIGCA